MLTPEQLALIRSVLAIQLREFFARSLFQEKSCREPYVGVRLRLPTAIQACGCRSSNGYRPLPL